MAKLTPETEGYLLSHFGCCAGLFPMGIRRVEKGR